jgi:hypothetical protein
MCSWFCKFWTIEIAYAASSEKHGEWRGASAQQSRYGSQLPDFLLSILVLELVFKDLVAGAKFE